MSRLSAANTRGLHVGRSDGALCLGSKFTSAGIPIVVAPSMCLMSVSKMMIGQIGLIVIVKEGRTVIGQTGPIIAIEKRKMIGQSGSIIAIEKRK